MGLRKNGHDGNSLPTVLPWVCEVHKRQRKRVAVRHRRVPLGRFDGHLQNLLIETVHCIGLVSRSGARSAREHGFAHVGRPTKYNSLTVNTWGALPRVRALRTTRLQPGKHGEMTMRFATLLLLAGAPCLLSGCVTGMAGSSRRICYDAGLQLGTPEFSSCWKGVRKQQFANDGLIIEGLVATAAVVSAATLAAQNADAANTRRKSDEGSTRTPAPVHFVPFAANASTGASSFYNISSPRLCPDGHYVVGICTIAPDGAYVGGQPQIAPDGTFVAGMPRIAPDGSYVGGVGPITPCPDGSYVAGKFCRVVPDGNYVGQQ